MIEYLAEHLADGNFFFYVAGLALGYWLRGNTKTNYRLRGKYEAIRLRHIPRRKR